MARPELRLAGGGEAPRADGAAHRRGAPWVGVAILAFAPLASLLGAGPAREPRDVRALAEEALVAAIDGGAGAPEVRDAAVRLREDVGRRPLDAATHVVYASLLLELAASPEERRAAAFHASRAAALAPVTVPVVETAARVLARAGEPGKALDLARSMFDYDPTAAARLAASLEALPGGESVAAAIPRTPAARAAWIGRLRASGRQAEAQDALDDAWARWPREPWVRRQAALRALSRGDWTALAEIVPPAEAIPESRDSAILHAFRGRLRAATGDLEGARSDAEAAARLGGGDAWVRLHAGLAMDAAGDGAAARAHWESGLHALPAAEGTRRLRVQILTQLARLADREGREGDALRIRREIAGTDPENAEAAARAGR